MISGPDIITYIGVPLAVLGVLPIIYNTIATLATLAKVRRALRHGRLAGITRGDVINHVIEVELPRYTIAPLHRYEHDDYWRLCSYPSQIPGGSWTLFNWRTNIIGLKTQRIDYSDQLRQPQAEIGFEELLSFLLDLGAVPDAIGFHLLRGSGLWVPKGTPLLVSPDGHEKALTIGSLDDSDGHLSLSVRWSSDWSMRDQSSLPPYWVLIKGHTPTPKKHESDVTEDAKDHVDEETKTLIASDEKIISPSSSDEKESKTSKYIPKSTLSAPAIRCQVGLHGLMSAVSDDIDAHMFDGLDTQHLQVDETGTNTTGIWFASAITAFGTSSQTILWNYKIPSDILSFAKKDTIPCGVLVLLDMVEESATPEWATQYNDAEEDRAAQLRGLRESSRALMAEASMTPTERSRAVRDRQMKQHEDWVESLNAKRRRDAQRAETRTMEALQSPRWGNKLVADHALKWLRRTHPELVDEDWDLAICVENLLHRMITDVSFALTIGKMLDSWHAFYVNGGIRKAEYTSLQEDKLNFVYAALILAIIEGSVSAAHGSLAADLQECVRIWKVVRLG
ncbi:hypothetical protein B0O99DRAFT_639887 [Bisporella sp. PMI_857]|nr:hypothetical protein B0O99DRAFT_639887 [Bisporella sp. PMI_857]